MASGLFKEHRLAKKYVSDYLQGSIEMFHDDSSFMTEVKNVLQGVPAGEYSARACEHLREEWTSLETDKDTSSTL